ncbi:MAG: hypothetical protein U0794_15760 [Isosphaeraceae bacterium]
MRRGFLMAGGSMKQLALSLLWASCLCTLTGCAQSGGFLAKRTTVGSLKASVSQLEFENQQLKKEVASLRTDNRQIENRLVQEESLNGELSARLDDARALLGQRGGTASASNDVDPEPTGPRTLPAGRSTRKARKPPFAQIPGRIDSVPGNDSSSLDNDGPSPSVNGSWRGDPGPQSSRSDPTLWLPVARGTSEPSPPRR